MHNAFAFGFVGFFVGFLWGFYGYVQAEARMYCVSASLFFFFSISISTVCLSSGVLSSSLVVCYLCMLLAVIILWVILLAWLVWVNVVFGC